MSEVMIYIAFDSGKCEKKELMLLNCLNSVTVLEKGPGYAEHYYSYQQEIMAVESLVLRCIGEVEPCEHQEIWPFFEDRSYGTSWKILDFLMC